MLRRLFDFFEQRRQARFARANGRAIAGEPDAVTPVVQIEQRDRAVGRRDLGVVPRSDEGLAGTRGALRGFARVSELVREHMRGERLGRRIGGIVDHEPACAEHGFDEPAERLRHAAARTIGGRDGFDNRRREFRGGEGGRERGDRLVDLLVQRQP